MRIDVNYPLYRCSLVVALSWAPTARPCSRGSTMGYATRQTSMNCLSHCRIAARKSLCTVPVYYVVPVSYGDKLHLFPATPLLQVHNVL